MTIPETILDTDEYRRRVRNLGVLISQDHPDGVVLIAVLKGALIFAADLARALTVPMEIDFMAISRFAPDSGRARITKDLELPITGRPVVVVEDIVDTGLTLAFLREHLSGFAPSSLKVATLLSRPSRRIVPEKVDYQVAELEGDAFAVGCGLHVKDVYRNVPLVATVDRKMVQEDPFAYVGQLYPRWRRPEKKV